MFYYAQLMRKYKFLTDFIKYFLEFLILEKE